MHRISDGGTRRRERAAIDAYRAAHRLGRRDAYAAHAHLAVVGVAEPDAPVVGVCAFPHA